MKKILLTLLLVLTINAVPLSNARAGTIYDIATGNDDWYSRFTDGVGFSYFYTTTTIYAQWNRFLSPYIRDGAYGDIDLSPIPDTDIITAATLYYYVHSYTSSRGTSKIYTIGSTDYGGNIVINKAYTSTGWNSQVLTAAQYGSLTKTGLSQFYFSVPDPGTSKSRYMQLRAYEYSPTDIYDMYLDVTHGPASTRNRIMIISLMKFKLEETQQYA